MTMRSLTILLVLAVSACASSGPGPGSEVSKPMERVVASDNQGVIRSSVEANATVTIDVPPARVLAVIKSVYDELGIPSATVDAADGTITAPKFFKTGRLGNANLSMYFNCGTSLTGNIADNYRIYMTVVSSVRSDGKGGTALETAVAGDAANMGGASGGKIPCGTTGRLEERIQDGVRKKVSAGQ
jgi:hypothetical protein